MRAAKRKIVASRARGKLHLQVEQSLENMIRRRLEIEEIVEMMVARRLFQLVGVVLEGRFGKVRV